MRILIATFEAMMRMCLTVVQGKAVFGDVDIMQQRMEMTGSMLTVRIPKAVDVTSMTVDGNQTNAEIEAGLAMACAEFSMKEHWNEFDGMTDNEINTWLAIHSMAITKTVPLPKNMTLDPIFTSVMLVTST